MTVLELALIDIRNFKEVKKIILKPGINIIQGGNGSGKTTLFEVFSHLFFPVRAPYSETRSSQAAILFKTNDGDIYRLIKNFSKRAAQLYKMDAAKKLVVVEKEEQNVQNRLNLLLHVDDTGLQEVFSWFFLNKGALPSLRPVRLIRNFAPRPAVFPPTAETDLSKEKIQERLEELRKQSVQADAVAQKESEMLDYKDKAFSLNRTLNDLEAIEIELAGSIEKEKDFPGFDSIPRDIKNMIEDYEKTLAEKNSEEHQLIDEKEIIEQQLILDQPNLIQNKFLWGGAGLVLMTIAVGVVLDLEGLYKHLNFLGLLTGFGLILFALIGDFRSISRRKIWRGKLENKNKNLEILAARFRRENVKYFEGLEKTNSPDKETFETRLSSFYSLKEDERNLLSRRNQVLGEKTKEAIEAEIKEAADKANLLEKEINQIKPGAIDPYVIQNEIKMLEEKLSTEDSFLLQDGPVAISSTEERFSGSYESISVFFEDDWPLILKACSLTPEEVSEKIQKRVSHYTGNQFHLEVGQQGTLTFNQDLETLSSGTLDHLFLVLCLVRVELFQNVPIPLFLDDPFLTLDSSRLTLILNALKALASFRQVILFSNSNDSNDTANVIKL